MSLLSQNILDSHLIRPRPPKMVLAPLWKRVLNICIDYLGAILFLTVIFVFISLLTGTIWGSQLAAHKHQHPHALQLLGVFSIYVYYVTSEYYLSGRTLGKVLTGTKVVNRKGQVPTIQKILLRSLIRLIPLEPLSILLTGNLGWHDEWSGTMVIED